MPQLIEKEAFVKIFHFFYKKTTFKFWGMENILMDQLKPFLIPF